MNNRPISAEQAALEAHVLQRLEAHDVNVLLDYATFVEQELDSEPIRNLCLGILHVNPCQWGFICAEVGTHSRSLGAALHDLGALIEKHRAAFLTQSAKAILAETQGEQA